MSCIFAVLVTLPLNIVPIWREPQSRGKAGLYLLLSKPKRAEHLYLCRAHRLGSVSQRPHLGHEASGEAEVVCSSCREACGECWGVADPAALWQVSWQWQHQCQHPQQTILVARSRLCLASLDPYSFPSPTPLAFPPILWAARHSFSKFISRSS